MKWDKWTGAIKVALAVNSVRPRRQRRLPTFRGPAEGLWILYAGDYK